MMLSRNLLFLSFSTVLLLGGCGAWDSSLSSDTSGPKKADSPENLLAAEGSWALVEDKNAPDPLSMHQNARTKVDPADQRKKQYVPESQVADVEQGGDMNFRLIRMEREVQGLRQDFNKLLPPLSNLIVADRKLDTTIDEIAMDQESRDMAPVSAKPEAPVHPSAPVPVTAHANSGVSQAVRVAAASSGAEKQVSSPVAQIMPSSGGGGVEVSQIRLGEHPGKTRVVLDLTGASTYRVDVDNNEKLLTVDLPQAAWNAGAKHALKNPLVAGYSAQPSASGGTTLVVELKKPVKVVGSAALKPESGKGNRIYFDLAAG